MKLVPENVIKLARGSLNNIFKDSFHEILSEQLTHDRSYISQIEMVSYQFGLANQIALISKFIISLTILEGISVSGTGDVACLVRTSMIQ